MSGTPREVLRIFPKTELCFEGPFTDVITSNIDLTNITDQVVSYKVKTTAPKSYCVRPSSGFIDPYQTVKVSLMLQPFIYDPTAKLNHKFLIQSILVTEDPLPTIDQLWKDVPRDRLMDTRLCCVLRMPGELMVEPLKDLIFDGPYSNPVTSFINLSNPSTHTLRFKLTSSSTHFVLSQEKGVIPPGAKLCIKVTFQPKDYDFTSSIRERISVHSATDEENDEQSFIESRVLKCVLKDSMQEQEAANVSSIPHQKAAQDTNSNQIEKLMKEIALLRNENESLKVSDIKSRHGILCGTCQMPADSGGRGMQTSSSRKSDLSMVGSLLVNIPPILYLIIALLVGIVFGRYIL